MTDQNTADGARNVDFVEYYGSISATIPTPVTDLGLSYLLWIFAVRLAAR